MNDNFYKQLIRESPTGYAYQRIICDKDDIPCDYEFIEVNLAFEKLTGLKGSDIVGRKITKVLPDIRKSEFDWIHFYGDVAINGDEKNLEHFSESLQRWYRISISSPEKYYFITHFIDITKEKTLSSEMEKLLDISEEFLQLNEQKIDYQKIEDNLRHEKILTDAIFYSAPGMLYLYDDQGKLVGWNKNISTLHEKNKREEQHFHRVSVLCKSMGEVLGLPDYKNEEFKSVGLLHDIGKIAIDESVLNQPGKLRIS